MTTQPNDVMRMFGLLKRWLSSDQFLNFDYEAYSNKPRWMGKVESFLSGFPPARFRLFRNFMATVPFQMSTMATPLIVQSGYRAVGIYPPRPEVFASRWAHWEVLNAKEKDYFMDCCKLIAIQILSGNAEGFDGYVIKGTQCDLLAENLLVDSLEPVTRGVDDKVVTDGQQITDLHFSRWRFTFLTNEVREELLERLEKDCVEESRKAIVAKEREATKCEKERVKKTKSDYAETAEGIREGSLAASKKS